MATPQAKWYALAPDQVLAQEEVSQAQGLSTQQVQTRRDRFGKNELPTQEGTTLLQMIMGQFTDIMIIVLLVAAGISLAIGEGEDAFVIVAIVILNAIIGVYQERQAENALAALSKLQTPFVRVRRGGQVVQVSATDLVPGDIVLLEAGDSIPADGRLLQAANLKVDEAAMTGESLAVDKVVNSQEDSVPPPALADRHNMVYMGTSVTYGRAEFVVTETGLSTQLGNIAALLQSVEQGRTPLQERLERVGYWLAGGALVVCVIVFVAGVLRDEPFQEMFLTSVSLAVAAIPEGLPAVITVALALGANRMVKRNALIRKLPAVETLGSVTTICSDKTGTLTRNEMTVTTLLLPERSPITLTGVGYEPVGQFLEGEKRESLHVVNDEQLARAVQAAALCTDAHVQREGESGPWRIIGDTTEGALLVMAQKQGWMRHQLEDDLPRVGEIPFTAERKAMTTLHKPGADFSSGLFAQAPYVAFVKGAPDQLLAWCEAEILPSGQAAPLDDAGREQRQAQIEGLAGQGIRVLGVAYRALDSLPESPTPETVERDLCFLGLVGMIDPPRTEAMQAVAVARRAGIRSVMITGDHKLTAASIAHQLNILGPEVPEGEGVLTGADLDQMTPEALQEVARTTRVYARVSPEHKLRVVEALQKNGEIVAMTGDGVNDAPALKQANIGVAMGITGTDVSKGAADMVLTDDNFASIVAAVEEGRTIYDNIRKFLRYLIGSNAGEIITMFGAIIAGLKLPLLATQILWVNLVTDGLPAIALGFEKGEPDVMDRPPRSPRESIFARGVGMHVVWVGIWMGAVSLISFIYALNQHGGEVFDPTDENLAIARTMAFTTLSIAQLVHVMGIHAGSAAFLEAPIWESRWLFGAVLGTAALQIAVIYLPFTEELLGTVPLRVEELLVAFLLAFSILPPLEVDKAILRRYEARRAALRHG
ncbi:MAG: cation-translocating P-type ATPase [Anaerolineae bacterium]|nr:cation-translocating P-type ATPase [Anaerolineae bacterium]